MQSLLPRVRPPLQLAQQLHRLQQLSTLLQADMGLPDFCDLLRISARIWTNRRHYLLSELSLSLANHHRIIGVFRGNRLSNRPYFDA